LLSSWLTTNQSNSYDPKKCNWVAWKLSSPGKDLINQKDENQLSCIDIANYIGRTSLHQLILKSEASYTSYQPMIEEILRLPTSEDRLIKTIQKQKNVSFVELIEGSTPLPSITGKLVLSCGEGQAKELQADLLSLIGACSALKYPLQEKTHSPAFLRKIPHLHQRPHANMIDHHLHSYKTNISFELKHQSSPSTIVKVPEKCLRSNLTTNQIHLQSYCNSHQQHFFGCEAFLTVSAQLHLEALSASLGRVYSFGPTSRAEKSQTNCYLAKLWMLKAELLLIEDLESPMNGLESLLKPIIWNLHQSNSLSSQDLKSLGVPKQTYDSTVVNLIQYHHNKHPSGKNMLPLIIWGQLLASEHEKWLAGSYAQGPIFVTDYPASFKPLYMRQTKLSSSSSLHGQTVACFDLLVPGVGELVGGSLQELNLDKLHKNMIHKGMISDGLASLNGEDHKFQWYLELRKYGNPATGGFGIGWERLLSWITGVEHVQECIAFPHITGLGHC
ncbi:hypothetical protein PSTT_14346, partial [Puccinia striiformis]